MRRPHTLGLVALVVAAPALGYWAETHEVFNKAVFQEAEWPAFQRGGQPVTTPDGYLSRVLYLNDGQYRFLRGVPFSQPTCLINTCSYSADKPTDAPTERHTAWRWTARGGLWEDGFENYTQATRWGGLRAVNHFHIPLGARSAGGGYSGITRNAANNASHQPYVDLLRSGISTTQWVMGANSGGDTNYWGWPAVGESMERFYLEKTQERRESGLSSALRAAGQVMHLIEDNTVPDHARDLAHPGDGEEEYVKDHLATLKDIPPGEWTTFPLKYIEDKGMAGFWDRDVYSTSPAVTLSTTEPPGISEYTQANFLAWNVKDVSGVQAYFSTIPYTWNVGFDAFPWPRYQPPSGATAYYGASVASSLNLPKLMHFEADELTFQPNDVNSPNVATINNRIDAACWADYAPPLLEHALGYARSVLPLMLPPARAEVVPDPAEPITRAKVRLWNLAPAGTAYAVTWKLDDAQLMALNVPQQAGAPMNAPIAITFSTDTSVAPGAMAESLPFTITAKQRGLLSSASYSAVVVKAHLGNAVRTPLTFGVPIPNGFPIVRQLELTDLTAPATRTATCDPSACGDESVTVSVRQPFDQSLRVSVELFAPWVDLLGDPADARVKAAAAADVHLAGLAVGSWLPASGTLPDFNAPRWPTSATFGAVPPGLVQSDVARFFRADTAPDSPTPGEVPVTLTLHLNEFIRADQDALLASESTHLAIWTTSGALYLVRLVLWPLYNRQTAAQIATDFGCSLTGDQPVPWLAVGGCTSPSSQPMCDRGPSKQYSYGKLTAPWSGVGGFTVGTDFGGASVSGTNTLKIVTLGGMQVASASLGGIDPFCPVNALASWGSTTMTLVCNPGPGGARYESTYTEGGPVCPSTPQTQLTLSATLRPRQESPDKEFWQQTLGRTDPLPDFTLTAH